VPGSTWLASSANAHECLDTKTCQQACHFHMSNDADMHKTHTQTHKHTHTQTHTHTNTHTPQVEGSMVTHVGFSGSVAWATELVDMQPQVCVHMCCTCRLIVHVGIHTRVYVCMHASMYACVCACVYACMYVCMCINSERATSRTGSIAWAYSVRGILSTVWCVGARACEGLSIILPPYGTLPP
jgi:hypothetical protein